VPIVANSIGTCADVNACLIKTTSAELFITNIDGQVNELRNLVRDADLRRDRRTLARPRLGLFPRANRATTARGGDERIETVAETNDLGYRLTEGDEDELGRLRRVFQPAALVRGKQPDPAAPVGRGRQS